MSTENGYTVGDEMEGGGSKAIKKILVVVSILIYVVGIAYAEVHGYSLLSKGINPDLMLWAVIGIFALGLTALALPAALHFWFHAPMQKIVGYGFYAIDLILLFFNAIADYGVNTGEALPFWVQLYMIYVVPATPIIVALGWSLLWIVDPSSQERASKEAFKAAVRDIVRKKIILAAKSADVDAQVEAAASAMANDLLGIALGSYAKLPAGKQVIEGTHYRDLTSHGNGVPHTKTKSFGKRIWDSIRPSQNGDGNGYHTDEEEFVVKINTDTKEVQVDSPKSKN